MKHLLITTIAAVVPVALGQEPGKPVGLKHTFSNQTAQFGRPVGETP
jgi:hypothetical protein